jgi:hypothetical protein
MAAQSSSMILSDFKSSISKHITNIPGWRTNRKLLVIESDDWGSIRMPSREVYYKLLKKGIRVDKCPYNLYDSLASEEDLQAIFDVLKSLKDKNGNHPVITANTIGANPDFEKIKASDFREYHYEAFTETLKKYPAHHNSFDIWKQGMKEKIFRPQFHGREHLNVNRWLKYLQNGSEETRIAFDHAMFGISTNITTEKRKSYLAALDFEDYSELDGQKIMLTDGLNLFEKIFEFQSESYIATNYIWHPAIEPVLAEKGVRYLQGSGAQGIPKPGKRMIHHHYLGQQNNLGQSYMIRNCMFEPSLNETKDWVSGCLKEISIAFLWNKPAVISSHRLNFIGFIDENNRKRNLKHLANLLKAIIKKWPEIEFMTTDQLGRTITEKAYGRKN